MLRIGTWPKDAQQELPFIDFDPEPVMATYGLRLLAYGGGEVADKSQADAQCRGLDDWCQDEAIAKPS
jgi:hypothetical protein